METILPEMKIHVTEDDIKYLLFEQPDVISDQIRQNGIWNPQILNYLIRVLNKQPNGTFIDIGAGFGSVTIPLAILFNGTIKFHSFEPLRIIFMQLATNVLINNLNNVKIENCALSNEHKRVLRENLDIYINGNHGAFSFNEEVNKMRNIVHSTEKDMFEFRTLDSYGFSDVKFVKISAPGMEFEVLEGAKNTLINNDKPPVLFETWGDSWYKEKVDRVIDFLKELNYSHFDNLGGYSVAYKGSAQRDFLVADIKTVKEGNFMVSEKMHDTELTLKDQKIYKP